MSHTAIIAVVCLQLSYFATCDTLILKKVILRHSQPAYEKKYCNNLPNVILKLIVLAAKIVANSGGIERFKNIDDFIQYAGIAPQEKSIGKTKRHKKAKGGNRKFNHALYLAALLQLRWNPKAKEYFEKKLKEGKTKKQALRCLMKRTACIVYGLLKSGQDYRAEN